MSDQFPEPMQPEKTPPGEYQPGLRIVCMSKGRPVDVQEMVMSLFPRPTIVVPQEEWGDYVDAGVDEQLLVPHPEQYTDEEGNQRELNGIGPVRQWCLDTFEEKVLVFMDDDVYELNSLLGWKGRDLSRPNLAKFVVRHTTQCAADAGVHLFGWSQVGSDVRRFYPQLPFSLASWSGSTIGVIGREVRYDPNLRLRADIDFFMQSLLKHRWMWLENRFSFAHHRFDMQGGLAGIRSSNENEKELEYLKQKWGQYLRFDKKKGTINIKLEVDRKWSLRQTA